MIALISDCFTKLIVYIFLLLIHSMRLHHILEQFFLFITAISVLILLYVNLIKKRHNTFPK